jgi:hypothetical protein
MTIQIVWRCRNYRRRFASQSLMTGGTVLLSMSELKCLTRNSSSYEELGIDDSIQKWVCTCINISGAKISADSPTSISRSQQRGYKPWLPNGCLKPMLPLMVSRTDSTMQAMGGSQKNFFKPLQTIWPEAFSMWHQCPFPEWHR